MGRKTFQSLGKPLPNRYSIVLSRSNIENVEGFDLATDIPTALMLADIYSIYNGLSKFFVIGGEEIFKEFDKFINVAWVTDVFTGPMQGDACFDVNFTPAEWWTRYEKDFQAGKGDDFGYRISCYIRRRFEHRLRSKEEFLAWDEGLRKALEAWGDREPTADVEAEVKQLSLF